MSVKGQYGSAPDHVLKINQFSSVDQVIAYAKKNKSSPSFLPYTCVATALKIKSLIEKRPLSEEVQTDLESVIKAKPLKTYNYDQLIQLVDFYGVYSPKSPLLQSLIRALLPKMAQADLKKYVSRFGSHFDVESWEIAISAMQKNNVAEIGKIVDLSLSKDFPPDALKRLQSYLTGLKIESSQSAPIGFLNFAKASVQTANAVPLSKTAAEMNSLNTVEELIKYADVNYTSFKPADCLFVANKIKFLFKGVPLAKEAHSILEKLFAVAIVESKDVTNDHLEQLLDFCRSHMPNTSATQSIISASLQKIDNPEKLRKFIDNFGLLFNTENWFIAVDAMQKQNLDEIGKIVESKLNMHICPMDDIKKLNSRMAQLRIEVELFLDLKQVTARIKNWKLYDEASFIRLLDLAARRPFNELHWAAFAKRLQEVNIKDFNRDLIEKKIAPILARLEEFQAELDPSMVAQVISGFIPYLHLVPVPKLLHRFKTDVAGMSSEELRYVLKAIRKLDKSGKHVIEMLEMIYNQMFLIPARRNELQDMSLLASFVNTCGKQQVFSFSNVPVKDFIGTIAQYIVVNGNRFSSHEQVLSVLEGLNMINQKVIRSEVVPALQKLVEVLLREIPKISKIEDRGYNIAAVAHNFALLRFLSLEWTQYALKEAQSQDFPIRNKVQLILALARLGQLNANAVDPQIRKFVRDFATDSHINLKYPEDKVLLAYSVAFLYKNTNNKLTHTLIKFALPQSTAISEDLRSMLYQAILLTDYPCADLPELKSEPTNSELQRHVIEKLKDRIKSDERFENAELKEEVPFLGYSFVDASIEEFNNSKPIYIEIDGPLHRTLNILPKEKQTRDLGATEAKHFLIESKAHLVAIRAESVDDPNLPNELENAWLKITTFIEKK